MRRITHTFCSPRNNHVLLTKLNTPSPKYNSLHPRSTNLLLVSPRSLGGRRGVCYLVDGGGDGGVGETCTPRDLPCGILSEIGAEDTAENTLLDTRCGNPSAFHGGYRLSSW